MYLYLRKRKKYPTMVFKDANKCHGRGGKKSLFIMDDETDE